MKMKFVPIIFAVCFSLPLYADTETDAEIAGKTAYVGQLEKDISRLNSELTRCKKSVDGWKAATIVGGIGTVGTVVGAAVQGAQILNAQKEGKTEKKKTGGAKNE